VLPGLLTALAAALCYGVGSVLQAAAARRADRADRLDPRLLGRLLGSWQYLLGLGLDVLGFALSLVAVRALPLFVVQAVVAGFLAVTAVLGAVFLRMPLDRRDRLALGVVVLGLILVAASAAEDRSVDVTSAERWGVLIVALLLALAALPAARLTGALSAAVLGTVAGLGYGATAVAARMLPAHLSVESLLRSPATWGLVVAGVVAMLTYSIALQRGTVTQATAPVVVAETIAPALVGITLLGDQARPGWGWVGAVGFALAVVGAVGLARHGEVAD
jgi:drug/metabolite transporter (DMT)-like permease